MNRATFSLIVWPEILPKIWQNLETTAAPGAAGADGAAAGSAEERGRRAAPRRAAGARVRRQNWQINEILQNFCKILAD